MLQRSGWGQELEIDVLCAIGALLAGLLHVTEESGPVMLWGLSRMCPEISLKPKSWRFLALVGSEILAGPQALRKLVHCVSVCRDLWHSTGCEEGFFYVHSTQVPSTALMTSFQ